MIGPYLIIALAVIGLNIFQSFLFWYVLHSDNANFEERKPLYKQQQLFWDKTQGLPYLREAILPVAKDSRVQELPWD